MGITSGTTGARMVSVEAIVTRADGTVENLGTLAYWHESRLKRWAFALGQLRKRIARRFTRKAK